MAIKAQSSNQVTRITVKQSRQNLPIELGQSAQYFNYLSELWATSPNIVENKDYSSKYYANKSQESATSAQTSATNASETYTQLQVTASQSLENIATTANTALENISNTEETSIANINTTVSENISTIESKVNEEIENLNKEIEQGKDEIKDAIDGIKVLTTLKIGQIGIAPLGIDETLNMERYLNGQIIIQDQFVGFTSFVKRRIALYPSIACTEEEWQIIVTNSDFSQCGKFVVDDETGTIRLPKVVNIQGLTDLSKLGEIVEAGLPTHTHTRGTMDITGTFGRMYNDNMTASGAFYTSSSSGNRSAGANSGDTGIWNFKASRNWTGSTSTGNYSKSLADSDTVQQEQIQYPYFIQVATGAEESVDVTRATEINNPFFLGMSQYFESAPNNPSWVKSTGTYLSKVVYPDYYDWLLKIYNGTETQEGASVKLATESYTDYDYVLNQTDETFRLPLLNGSEDLPSDRYEDLTLLASGSTYTASANGYVVWHRACSQIGQDIHLTNVTKTGGNTKSISMFPHSTVANEKLEAYLPVSKGDIFRTGYTADGNNNATANCFRFYYNKGNGSLYYYMGDGIVNPQLVNVARIEETLVDTMGEVSKKLDKNEVKAHIVETYNNGTSWYRIYSDGWIDQGGKIAINSATVGAGHYANKTLTFLKPFKKLVTWHCQARHDRFNAGFNNDVGGALSSVNVYQVNDSTNSYANPFVLWQASGYIT